MRLDPRLLIMYPATLYINLEKKLLDKTTILLQLQTCHYLIYNNLMMQHKPIIPYTIYQHRSYQISKHISVPKQLFFLSMTYHYYLNLFPHNLLIVLIVIHSPYFFCIIIYPHKTHILSFYWLNFIIPVYFASFLISFKIILTTFTTLYSLIHIKNLFIFFSTVLLWPSF